MNSSVSVSSSATTLTILLGIAVLAAREKNPGKQAVCLSGGIDSSTIACLAPDLPVVTGFYQYPGCDEREYAGQVAKGRDWHRVEITPEDFVRVFDDVNFALDGLSCGPGAVGQYVVAEHMAAEGFRVLFTGEGGDELFGGYARLHIVAGADPPEGYEQYLLPDGYPTGLRDALDLEWSDLRNLCQVDERVAGAHGIKVVPPMLDPWVVAYAHSLPVFKRVGKIVLRDAVRGLVPDYILDRKDKRGFPVPFVSWAQQEPVRSFIGDRIGYIPDPAKPWDRGWWEDMRGPVYARAA